MHQLAFPLALLAALSAGCSESIEPAATPDSTKSGTPAAPTPADPPAAAEFTVSGNDQMQFDVREIKVKAGQKVRITLKNVGSLPKIAMGHNLVVLRNNVTLAAFTPKVAAPKGTIENGYLPEEAKKDVLAHTKLLGPGESDAIEFTAPGLPGELVYLCTFPAHALIMNGKIVVQ